MKLPMCDGKTTEASDKIFGQPHNAALIHQAVLIDMGKGRVGKANKSRSEVAGSGKKPWRQKMTGRARVGGRQNPIWRGGGVAFAATPVRRKRKMSRKMFRAALRNALSALHAEQCLLVDDDVKLKEPRTKNMLEWMSTRRLGKSLIVVEKLDRNLELASRNLPGVEVVEAAWLDVVTLLRFEKVVLTQSALRCIEERLA